MNNTELVMLRSTESKAESEQIINYLKENGVQAVRQGGVMDIYAGSDLFGEQIMVAPSDLERAQELMKNFEPIRVTAKNLKNQLPKSQKTMNWILTAILFIILIVAVTALLQQ